ncbi:uncharacterized protein LOC110251832 [Exaiptasia diaphana]|uniref:Uncharacterized protein n=1 Tax=Exaiptasia diaphana TaxID=2652724 RepID=A0A913Y2V7_EXADI|nr:uncharacterized protein LOC110251832 [Exaiptasia diaphana]KXJ22738.1 hypothetical protein AC249_AIPGENE26038 [Exaiptasia diaphana]
MSLRKRVISNSSTSNKPPTKRKKIEQASLSTENPKIQSSKSKALCITKAKKTKNNKIAADCELKTPNKHPKVPKQQEIKRDKHGKIIFADYPDFKPNLTPKEVLQAGSFGGTYFRPIKSSITGEKYAAVWKEFPSDWFDGLSIPRQVVSSVYHTDVNTYKVKCGGSLEMWESSGWIVKQDPYGWFQWYCRFFLGRRSDDDSRQVGRWLRCAGDKGRWRNNLITKVVRSGCGYDNAGVSPVVRQTLQHWAYRLTKEDYDKYAKKVKPK